MSNARSSVGGNSARGLVVLAVLFAWLGAGLPAAGAQKGAGKAQVSLKNASASLTQTSATEYTLEKTGTVGPATVTWDITATEGATVGGLLILEGELKLKNTGGGGATIGNIVVNLQTQVNNTWVTQSSDIADAAQDDAATIATIAPTASSEGFSTFTENAASGELLLTDATTNSLFALVPQVTIAPGATQTLLFSAAFDNNVLNLPVGTPVRAEVIVSFGNAKAGGNSTPNVDINGNGIIDADEDWVRSVPARIVFTVPAEQPSNADVVLSDTVQDLTTTGTVTFSNPIISLDQTTLSGTVMVDYDSGADGGTITNCAHLTGDGVDLTACDTQTIGPPGCTPGAPGCGWEAGDALTYNQINWGDAVAAAGVLLANQFDTIYFGTVLEVGIPGTAGFSMQFSDAGSVLAYLPSVGTVGPLNSDLGNPTSSASGTYGGEVVALKLNVDFSDANVLGPPSIDFGNLLLCGFSAQPALNGMTIRDFLAVNHNALGGGSPLYPIDDLFLITREVNSAFESGAPSSFAQTHVFNGACPTCTPGTPGCGWQDGDMVSYGQDSWGGDPTLSTTAALVLAQFDSQYPGGLEVGLSGSAGFSMIFTSGSAVLDYLPGSGTPGSLNADLIDPTSTSSGVFGGHVLALQLDVDFTDAGLVAGTSGLAFGDLRICGLTTTPGFNGMTIRQFLAAMNSVLGGGPVPHNFDDISFLTSDITTAFEGGAPSVFAQQHLFSTPCPTCTPGTLGCGWEDGDVITHTQQVWGDPTSSAGILLNNQFNVVYPNGFLEAGLPGMAGFSMFFTSADAVLDYLPAVGNVGALNADLVDPTTTASGAFGGEVVALTLNADFSRAGHTAGTSGLRFGDLTLCGFTAEPLLNGITVADFLAMLNSALGGGFAPYTITVLHDHAQQVNAAFNGGVPSVFAQDHLFNGACPP